MCDEADKELGNDNLVLNASKRRWCTVQQAQLQACIREHVGLSADEVMSLLARFRVGSRGQSAPCLSLEPGSGLLCNIKSWDPFLLEYSVFLSNECLR